MTFEQTGGAPFDFHAGQWVSLVLPLEEGEARRAYSIASPPNGSARFSIAVTRVDTGTGSKYLHSLGEGTTIRAIGPQGFFTRQRGTRHPSLFIGTGTGVTPLRSMILDAVAQKDPSALWLLFGVRHEADRIYLDEFEQLAKDNPNVRIEYSLSKPEASFSGRRGHVQTHVEALWKELTALGEPHAYICGLERMVGAVRDLLRKQMNVPRQQVHSERYD